VRSVRHLPESTNCVSDWRLNALPFGGQCKLAQTGEQSCWVFPQKIWKPRSVGELKGSPGKGGTGNYATGHKMLFDFGFYNWILALYDSFGAVGCLGALFFLFAVFLQLCDFL